MIPQPQIQTVLFDVGGTLLRVHPSVGDVYSAVAAEHGFSVASDLIQRGFRVAWKRSLERSRLRCFRTSDRILRGEWFEIVRETFGESIPAGSLPALFEDLYERFASAKTWRLVPGIRETLQYLRGIGVRLGILSNWDSRLERMLAELGLLSAFEFFVISHDVGYEKPDAAIFREALSLSGSEPTRTLHVGDSYPADIVPARSLGMQTLWIAPDDERDLQRDGGPGIDSLPANPIPFWHGIIESPDTNGAQKR